MATSDSSAFREFSQFRPDQLALAFDRIRDHHDWKSPIRARIHEVDRAISAAAIEWFTGTSAQFSPLPDSPGMLLVTAPGQRLGPAGHPDELPRRTASVIHPGEACHPAPAMASHGHAVRTVKRFTTMLIIGGAVLVPAPLVAQATATLVQSRATHHTATPRPMRLSMVVRYGPHSTDSTAPRNPSVDRRLIDVAVVHVLGRIRSNPLTLVAGVTRNE